MAHLDLQTGTYAAADTLLGSRTHRKIGHNTTLARRYVGTYLDSDPALIAVRYHATDIVTFSADGWLTMSTGGWDTVTTWSRINALLPGRWACYSRNGSRYLYHGGRPVTPYVDGLQVNAATGAVGINGDTLLTADDIAAIETAYDAAETARADKRAARLLREHPTVNGPRTHTRSLYDQRARGCDRCDAELAAIRAARQDVLAAEHVASHPIGSLEAAGSHATTDYAGKVRIACPWDCPNRARSW